VKNLKYSNNKYGFASTAASPAKGIGYGFEHRKSHKLFHGHHMARNFGFDKNKYDNLQNMPNALSYGRRKIDDLYETRVPEFQHLNGRSRRSDLLTHSRYSLPLTNSAYLQNGITVVPRIETPKFLPRIFHYHQK